MPPRPASSVSERLTLVELMETGVSCAEASQRLGYSRAWGQKWWHRYRIGGQTALDPAPAASPGPGSSFASVVQQAVGDWRQRHPRLGARIAQMRLAEDAALAGQRLPSARTIHRAWVAAGLVPPRVPRDIPAPLAQVDGMGIDPHAVWQIDHQDHLHVTGCDTSVVLQSVRAPAAALVIGADLFPGPSGAHAVPLDDVLDAVRGCFVQWGRPQVLSVDGGVHFLGHPQRTFPSRLELFCAGLGVTVRPIRRGRPTDHAGVERQHALCDGVLMGPPYADLAAAQAALTAHVTALNTRFPSRARVCRGQPPLTAFPRAQHSGRPYDPAHEWETFDLAAVDARLTGWTWYRHVGATTGQISFANVNVGVGKAWRGRTVTLRFDPSDRQVVIYGPGTRPHERGPELKRFHCPAFTKEVILGQSRLATRPVSSTALCPHGTAPATPL